RAGRHTRCRCFRHWHATQTSVSSSTGRASAGCGATGPAIIGFISKLFHSSESVITEASARHASAIAALHDRSFRRGWSEQEVEGMLLDRHVIAHRATSGAKLDGFILSLLEEDEPEILPVDVAERH